MKKRITEKKHKANRGILISTIFGLCVSMLILLILLMIFSLIGLATENPHALLSPLSFFSIYTSAFFGGFTAIKKNKGHDPCICGILCGIIIMITFSLIFGIVGIICNVDSTPISWVYRVLMLPSTLIGSIIGLTKKNKIPKHKKRKKWF